MLEELWSLPEPRMTTLLFGGTSVFTFAFGVISWLSDQTLQFPAPALQPARADSLASSTDPSTSWHRPLRLASWILRPPDMNSFSTLKCVSGLWLEPLDLQHVARSLALSYI